MSQKKQSQGECVFCGREMAKGGLSRHLKTCPQRQEVIKVADNNEKAGQKQRLYHLQVQDAWSPDFWLHLEMNGTACEKHAKEHPHENYGEPIPLVNSPRLGMCGYDGPAAPPY
jgi:hypothetical protein